MSNCFNLDKNMCNHVHMLRVVVPMHFCIKMNSLTIYEHECLTLIK